MATSASRFPHGQALLQGPPWSGLFAALAGPGSPIARHLLPRPQVGKEDKAVVDALDVRLANLVKVSTRRSAPHQAAGTANACVKR